MAGELVTADGQMQFNDYLLGDDVITFLDEINGWEEIPSVDSGNTPKPASHGAWSGNKFSNQRIITWQGRFAPDVAAWTTELKRLRDNIALPESSEESEIVIRLHDEVFLAYGAVVQRALPGDRRFASYGPNLVIQFECSDPRRYSLTEHQQDLSFPSETTNGLIYPLVYKLDYGISPSSNGFINNAGNSSTPVVITIQGPVEDPAIFNITTGIRLQFNINIGETETLVIDTRTGTVLLNGVADRLYTRSVTSAPILSFGLAKGNNNISISANTWLFPAGVTIKWRDATI